MSYDIHHFNQLYLHGKHSLGTFYDMLLAYLNIYCCGEVSCKYEDQRDIEIRIDVNIRTEQRTTNNEDKDYRLDLETELNAADF